jgi:hypothetical protein
MDFVIGCILIGLALTGFLKFGSSIFWAEKDRRDDRKLRN